MDLFGGTIKTIEQSLDYATTKNNVISNNIANVDTPFYKASDVVFKNTLSKAMKGQLELRRTHNLHIPQAQLGKSYQTIVNNNTSFNHNGNNVDIEVEMAALAKNQIYYRSMVDRLNGKFNSLQTVISGGR